MKNLYTFTATYCLKIITVLLFSIPFTGKSQESMRANLYVIDATGSILVDGNLTNYNNIYSNAVDINDAWKMTNPGINFGILRDGYNLVVERRSLIGNADTTFFRMWNMPQYHYRIKFILNNLHHPGLKAELKDNYLHTSTPIGLNDTTNYDFNVDAIAASADQMRFQLIYSSTYFAPVDVNFAGIKLQRKGRNVLVAWDIANEVSVESYTIEHSLDGKNFNDIQQIAAYNTPVSKTYKYEDLQATYADNYYRIRATNFGGKIQYSTVAKINSMVTNASIFVYPNPVVNNLVQLHYTGQPAGMYNLVLVHSNGTKQPLPSILLNEGQGLKSINLPQNLSKGIYLLQIIGPGNKKTVNTIQVL